MDLLSGGGSELFDLSLLKLKYPGKKILLGGTQTSDNRSTLRATNDTSGYSPPAGRKFILQAVIHISLDAGGNKYAFYQTDNDVGFSSATPFVNEVNAAGATTSGVLRWQSFTVGQVVSSFPVFAEVAAGKFLSLQASDGSGDKICRHIAIGIEVPL